MRENSLNHYLTARENRMSKKNLVLEIWPKTCFPGMPWACPGQILAPKFFEIFFYIFTRIEAWRIQNAKKSPKIFFPIVAHLGHPGLTLRKFFENFKKITFLNFGKKRL